MDVLSDDMNGFFNPIYEDLSLLFGAEPSDLKIRRTASSGLPSGHVPTSVSDVARGAAVMAETFRVLLSLKERSVALLADPDVERPVSELSFSFCDPYANYYRDSKLVGYLHRGSEKIRVFAWRNASASNDVITVGFGGAVCAESGYKAPITIDGHAMTGDELDELIFWLSDTSKVWE